MKLNNYVKMGLATLSLVVGWTVAGGTASAHSFTYWTHPHWVTVTKTTTIAKNKNTYPLYKSYTVQEYNVYPGHHLKVHHAASYDWVVESGTFNTNAHYTYAVERGSGTSWFKQGIHKITAKKNVAKYKSFHGYRVATSKSDYTYNTFYDTDIHATLSDYRPTQKSKVIFKHGSQVMPTHHMWTWFHGTDQNLLTDYRYIGGKWVNKGTTDVSDD